MIKITLMVTMIKITLMVTMIKMQLKKMLMKGVDEVPSQFIFDAGNERFSRLNCSVEDYGHLAYSNRYGDERGLRGDRGGFKGRDYSCYNNVNKGYLSDNGVSNWSLGNRHYGGNQTYQTYQTYQTNNNKGAQNSNLDSGFRRGGRGGRELDSKRGNSGQVKNKNLFAMNPGAKEYTPSK